MSATQIARRDLYPVENKVVETSGGGFDYTLTIHTNFITQTSGKLFVIQQVMKRIIDVVLASVGLVMLTPVLLAIAVALKVTSPGPIIYKSLRIGKEYKPFYMFKFRTMHVNADSMREELRKKANLEGNLFKLANDPRVIPFGQLLRKTSLDELPQLLNVIRGEMSLVGPRPLPPDESDLFEEPYTIRYRVTPGITGIWQVSGRSKLDFTQFCKLELTYVVKWNLLEDFKILFKTIPAVLMKNGAC
jgi:lipopolysaccharide/colanic/teichoic acid biosynthesis glycosyltransferase